MRTKLGSVGADSEPFSLSPGQDNKTILVSCLILCNTSDVEAEANVFVERAGETYSLATGLNIAPNSNFSFQGGSLLMSLGLGDSLKVSCDVGGLDVVCSHMVADGEISSSSSSGGFLGENITFIEDSESSSSSPSPITPAEFTQRVNMGVEARLSGKSPTSALAVYSSQDPYTNGGTFVRNPDCWLNGASNISCFSPAQMSGANWWQRGGTLLTRKHVLFAKHFRTSVISGGTPLRFVTSGGTTVTRNIIQYADHPWTDISIALLDSEVPSSISIAKVLPKNWVDYMEISGLNPVYAVGLDQQEKALVKISTGLSGQIISYQGQSINYKMFTVNESKMASSPFASFNETVITGDSGNPVFLLLGNELVVVTTWWTPTSGPFVSNEAVYDTVNALIESLSPGGGYAMEDIDLAGVFS